MLEHDGGLASHATEVSSSMPQQAVDPAGNLKTCLSFTRHVASCVPACHGQDGSSVYQHLHNLRKVFFPTARFGNQLSVNKVANVELPEVF